MNGFKFIKIKTIDKKNINEYLYLGYFKHSLTVLKL